MTLDRTGRFDVEKATALNIPQRAWNRLQKGETLEIDGNTYTPDMVLGPQRKGIKLTYTTDTRPTEGIVDEATGSDLLICEGMYGEEEKLENAKKNKHMTMYEAAKVARAAGVKELWLTHYSPSLTKPERYMKNVRKIFPQALAAKDGQSVTLGYED